MAEPQIQYCTTSDDVSIAYYVMGDGVPIVTTSGIWASHLQLQRTIPRFRAALEALERRHRVVRYDGRGSGLSQRTSPDFSLAPRLLDIEAVVDRLRLDRFTLIGARSSGLAAVAYAVRHPERLTHLILRDAWACGRDFYETSPEGRAVQSMRGLTEDQWESYVLTAASLVLGFSDADKAKEHAALMRASMEPDAMLAWRDATVDIDVTDLLPQVRVPTLVVCRPSQRALQPQSSQVLASRIPDARLVVLEPWAGTGVDEAWLRAVEEFLGDATPADEAYGAPSTVTPRAASTGMTAILFTDIVASTALTERMGDARFRDASRALDAQLRTAIRDAGGTPIDGKVLGDGVMATFLSASQAIAAALRCSEVSARSELQLHLGIHAGDVIREPDNVYGGAVNIASRICGLSAPGEILVSDVVRGMARTSAGVTFADRGDQEMKGVGDPVRVFAVLAIEESPQETS
jgi:class 3 adenylate cyclase